MLVRLSVRRNRFEAERDAILLEAVMNNQQAVDPISLDERIVFDADQYLGSVMMDGHFLSFHNHGLETAANWTKALHALEATTELSLLSKALELWKRDGRPEFSDANDTLTTAIDAIDHEFLAAARASDNLETRTKTYVDLHVESFISFE